MAATRERGPVSVVVPTHDRPELVRRTVQAVLDQDHPGEIEVLVVFDQCRPHPLPAPGRPGRTVSALVNDARAPGLAGARNTGLLAARGSHVAFCDDDDVWLPSKLSAQLQRLDAHPGPAACATGIYVETSTRRIRRDAPTRVLCHADFVRDRIMEVNPCTLLVRRSGLFDAVGLVDERVPAGYGEDYDFVLRLTRSMAVVCVPDPLVVVSYHGGSYYAANWRKMVDGLEYLRAKHPDLRIDRVGNARILGQLAVAHGGLGERRTCLRLAAAALRSNPRERRALVAAAVAAGLPAETVLGALRHLGRGV